MSARRVCLHGFLGAPAMWEGVLGGLDATLATLPGHGLDPWMPDGDFEAVARAFGERLGLSAPTVLVGYSMGARLALAMALQRPEVVARLVLIGVDPGLRDPEARAARRRWEDAQAERVEREGMAPFVAQWEALPVFASQRSLDEITLLRRRSERLGHTARGVAWAMRSLGTGRMPSYWEALGQVARKTVLVTGGRDEKFTALACETGLSYRVVAHAGHDVALEAPAALAAMLRGLLREDGVSDE